MAGAVRQIILAVAVAGAGAGACRSCSCSCSCCLDLTKHGAADNNEGVVVKHDADAVERHVALSFAPSLSDNLPTGTYHLHPLLSPSPPSPPAIHTPDSSPGDHDTTRQLRPSFPAGNGWGRRRGQGAMCCCKHHLRLIHTSLGLASTHPTCLHLYTHRMRANARSCAQ